ncbi:MAG TPA: ATP-binding protein [Actinomycetota bacterium]|nr:ATP-binding protein [Actinomycetota bacterium]
MTGSQRAVELYTLVLAAILAAVITAALALGASTVDVPVWVVFVILFALAEYGVVFFHRDGERVGLSASEAVLLPMIVALSFDQVVVGVSVAALLVAFAHHRVGWLKGLFNVAMFGCAAALAAGTWSWLSESATDLTLRNAAVAVVAVLVFSASTHVLVAVAIALSAGGSFVEVVRDVPRATLVNLATSSVLGLLLAAAHLADAWTLVLFPLALGGMYLGYRAVVRQEVETRRIEHLHAASRALASSAGLDEALVGFLKQVQKIVSAAEVHVVVDIPDGFAVTTVNEDGVVREMSVLSDDDPMASLLQTFERSPEPLLIARDASEREASLRDSLGVADLAAVPLVDNEAIVGALLAAHRRGAEEFGESDAAIMQSLAHELVLTLESYRLFDEIAEERERFRRIFTASKEGICLLDAHGVVRAWNPALVHITGYAAEEIVGQVWSDRIVLRTKDHRRIEDVEVVEVAADSELELVSKGGPSRWVSVLSSRVHASGEFGWVVLIRDVTSEHLAEEAKSDFLSTVSHELRTPLTTIKGSVGILAKGSANIPEKTFDQMLSVLRRGTDRLERLVMDLLFVSQLETDGQPKVALEEIDLADVVRKRAEFTLKDHPHSEMLLPEGELVVRADRERLTQVVRPLLENALKFGGDGSIRVRLSVVNGFAELAVADEGPGIPVPDQERIFERFVRLGNVLTRDTQGPGVGLFIARRSAEAMGGRVWVESTPGEGATFYASIPLARPMLVSDSAS